VCPRHSWPSFNPSRYESQAPFSRHLPFNVFRHWHRLTRYPCDHRVHSQDNIPSPKVDSPCPRSARHIVALWCVTQFHSPAYACIHTEHASGNMLQLYLPATWGEFDFSWQRQYGPLYRIKGCFGVCSFILNTSRGVEARLFCAGRSPRRV
jgi:hypothetical protein